MEIVDASKDTNTNNSVRVNNRIANSTSNGNLNSVENL